MAVGLSYSEYADDVIGEHERIATVVGPGVYYAFNDRWSSKADVRWFHDIKDNLNDSSLTVGISYRFGRLAPKRVIGDADNDGVNDDTDQCPLTPAGAAVDVNGCEFDTDRDGVVNSKDQCLYTPLGARVYTDGCAVKLTRTETMTLNVTFETDSSQLADSFIPEIEKVAQFMREYASVTSVIEGHTDSRGSATFNQQLSQLRAETVRSILINKFGVDAQRLKAIGYGEEKPIATNFFMDGRQQNRRVEAVFKAQITEKVRAK
jgi:OOP family OmpA-OmpF porin